AWALTGEPARAPVARGCRRIARPKRRLSSRGVSARTARAAATGTARAAAPGSAADAGTAGADEPREGAGSGGASPADQGDQPGKGYQPSPPLADDDFDDLDPESLAARLRDSDLPWKS